MQTWKTGLWPPMVDPIACYRVDPLPVGGFSFFGPKLGPRETEVPQGADALVSCLGRVWVEGLMLSDPLATLGVGHLSLIHI